MPDPQQPLQPAFLVPVSQALGEGKEEGEDLNFSEKHSVKRKTTSSFRLIKNFKYAKVFFLKLVIHDGGPPLSLVQLGVLF